MSPRSIPDEMVLAAIDRAERHRRRSGVPVWLIFEHLGIPRRSRNVRGQLRALAQAGAIAPIRAHGTEQWTLTPAGRRRVRRSTSIELPESPQHRAWRNARTLAGEEINRFRDGLRDAIADASALLDEGTTSDVWFQMADRLRAAAWRLGSAVYCLCEWAEPTDDIADLDERSDPADRTLAPTERARRETRRTGRRNTGLWTDSGL
jgi:hypothetical protein